MSNPEGSQSSVHINNASEGSGRRIREDNTVLNIADLAWIERYGPSLINGKPQGTVFGIDMVTAKENPAISSKWDMGIPLKLLEIDITGSAYIQCTLTEETLEIGTGTDADAEIKVWSIQRIRYEPGAPLYEKFTAAFPKLADSNGDYIAAVGLYDGVNGYMIAQRRRSGVLEYGFLVFRDAVYEWFDWNGSDFPEGMDLNDLNIFRLDGGYLGSAPTNVYTVNVDDEIFTRIHRQVYKQRITSVKTPDLPLGAFIKNEGNTLDIKILNGSIQGGTINGLQEGDPAARAKTYRLTKTIPTSAVDELIVSFKNELIVEMYDRLDSTGIPRIRDYFNTISSKLFEVSGVLDGQNKRGSIDLYATDIGDITSGTYTPVDLGFSVLEVSDDAVVDLTNAELLESFQFGANTGVPPKLIETLDLLFPGKVAVFVVNSTSVTFDITWKIKYQDRF